MGAVEGYGGVKRYIAFAWAYLECLGYSGIIYGWGSLVYVLKDEGFYSDECPAQNIFQGNNATSNETSPLSNDDNEEDIYNPSCDARDGMFNLIFTVASTILGVGICLLGMVSLRFGTRITRLITAIIFITGSLCIASATPDIPWLLFPGMSLMAVAGSGTLATNVQVSFLFPVWGSAVLSLLSGTYDASAAIQLLVKVGYENGISRATSYYILTGVFLLTLVNTFLLLPKHFALKQDDIDIDVDVESSDEEVTGKGKGEKMNVSGAEATTRVSRDSNGKVVDEKMKQKEMMKESNGSAGGASSKGQQPMENSTPSLSSVIISPEITFHAFWFCLLHLRHINYQATVNSMLEDVLDTDDEVSNYTNAFLYTLLSGIVVSFLPGLIYDYNVKMFKDSKSFAKRKLMPSLFPLVLTSLIAVILSTFTLFTGPTTLYVEFVLVVFLRAFLYSTLATYVRHLFPSEFFTTLYGILFMLAGLTSLLQYALFTWAESQGNTQVHIFLLVISLLTLVHPLYQWRQCR